MKKLGLILCVVVLSAALLACGNKEFLDGGNFLERQRNFYNDTINKANEFVDLTDEILDLYRDINEYSHLSLYISKTEGVDVVLASLVAQGTVTQEEINNFSKNCEYSLDFDISKISDETNDDYIGFSVFCFKNNNFAKDFYDFEPVKNRFGTTMTLSKNLVMYAYGNLSYDKNQIINTLNDLKATLPQDNKLPSWVLPVVIGESAIILFGGGLAAFFIIRKKKKENLDA